MDDQPSTPFMTTKEAARFLSERRGIPVAARTLCKLRVFGRLVVYASDALLNWAERRMSCPMRSTSYPTVEGR